MKQPWLHEKSAAFNWQYVWKSKPLGWETFLYKESENEVWRKIKKAMLVENYDLRKLYPGSEFINLTSEELFILVL